MPLPPIKLHFPLQFPIIKASDTGFTSFPQIKSQPTPQPLYMMFTYYTIQNRDIMKNVSIFKHRIFLQKNDMVEAVEIYENENLKYYSYLYKIWETKSQQGQGDWRILMRWDNYDEKPHVDIYGESRNLVRQHSTTEHKSLKEVTELIKIFRRNLVAMNFSEM